MAVAAPTRIIVALAILASFALAGCVSAQPGSASVTTTSTVGTSSPTIDATAPVASVPTKSVESTPATPASMPGRMVVSAESKAYARKLGGVSHRGDRLYFVVGVSTSSERDARSKLKAALPLFGDMQSYFIVQRSDNFDGMRPGYWVVIEAYRKRPSSENLEFGKRAFPSAYVRGATVMTKDPIPVYEDLVPGA